MLEKISPEQLPIMRVPEHKIVTLPTRVYSATLVDPLYSLMCKGKVQVICGMLYSQLSPHVTANIFFPRALSFIEVLSNDIANALIGISKQSSMLVGNDGVIGLQAKGLTDQALKAYLDLSQTGRIDKCIGELFQQHPFKIKDIVPIGTSIYEFKSEEADTITSISIDLLMNNQVYLYLASEAARDGITSSIPLIGMTLKEIESNRYFKEMLKIFKNVYFLGVDTDTSWYSLQLSVTRHLDAIDTLLSQECRQLFA